MSNTKNKQIFLDRIRKRIDRYRHDTSVNYLACAAGKKSDFDYNVCNADLMQKLIDDIDKMIEEDQLLETLPDVKLW